MKNLNKLNEMPIAELNHHELDKLTHLEKDLNEKYYIIAFDRQQDTTPMDDQSRQYVYYE
ncbi:hypothetical protein HZI73_18980 [Vallitalea pronyensis]|uniref:Uncharacterized protein n=1 Tax=Vallitalea pronyensis TaxID=1348613 RepID=A0A8J8MN17_9FIRM|nr:hypothetical protein [Vallitalea pronyensis]QUI24248.1 hypothetical protein HZI73_18980 [Vallitalea pronyensis]